MHRKPKRPNRSEPIPKRSFRSLCLFLLFMAGISLVLGTPSVKETERIDIALKQPKGPYAKEYNELHTRLMLMEIILEKFKKLEETATSLEEEEKYKKEVAITEGMIEQMKANLAKIRMKAAKAQRSKSGGCFTADMWVLTVDGAKPIADIRVGDKVLSRDDAGNQVPADVLKTYTEENYHYFLINNSIKKPPRWAMPRPHII